MQFNKLEFATPTTPSDLAGPEGKDSADNCNKSLFGRNYGGH